MSTVNHAEEKIPRPRFWPPCTHQNATRASHNAGKFDFFEARRRVSRACFILQYWGFETDKRENISWSKLVPSMRISTRNKNRYHFFPWQVRIVSLLAFQGSPVRTWCSIAYFLINTSFWYNIICKTRQPHTHGKCHFERCNPMWTLRFRLILAKAAVINSCS